MLTIPKGVIDARHAAFDACMNPLLTFVDTFERLAVLNLNTARGLVEDGTARVHEALDGSPNPGKLIELPTTWAETTAQRALAYQRGCYDILAQTVEEAVKPLEMHFSEVNKLIAVNLEKAAKAAPVGSDVALAAVQSAIAAANSTFDSMSKATRQVVDLTEANLANAVMGANRLPAAAAPAPAPAAADGSSQSG